MPIKATPTPGKTLISPKDHALVELQRDWARTETYDLTTGVAKKFAGGYGLGIIYAKTMFGAHEG